MAALTFGELWRQFALEYSAIDPMLCRQWVLNAFKRACNDREWGFLRTDGQLTTQAPRDLAVVLTAGSATVTSAGLFVAGDNTRQFRVGGIGIPYTIAFVDINTITLDRTWEGTAGAATGTILDAYVAMPENFGSFRTLVNPEVYRPMPWMLDRSYVDYWDPNRTTVNSTARMVVAFQMSNAPSLAGRVLYEWWPYPSAAQAYPMTYYKRPDTIADTETMPGVLATRCEDLLPYARYRASLYPGTVEHKNPGYNPTVAQLHRAEWEQVLQQLNIRDDDVLPHTLETVDWRWVLGGMPFDSAMLRATDASGYDGFFGGYSY